MKTRTQLDERSFEQLLAAAYMLQQQRESLTFRAAKQPPAMSEDERLSAIAETQAMLHGDQLRLQQILHLVVERAQCITAGAGAALWLLRGSQAVCQAATGVLAASTGQGMGLEGNRLTACLRDGTVLRCADADADPRTRYDALPAIAKGAVVAVPIHFEGRVQGALEVTFAKAWGFEDADVRTCQILSGMLSEVVMVAAGQERKNALESERATLLDALDRLQPHLSKLLNNVEVETPARKHDEGEESEEMLLPSATFPPASAGPTHGLARLGKYLLDQQEHHGDSSYDLEQETVAKPGAREVQTALNFSVTAQQPAIAHVSSGLSHSEHNDFNELEPEAEDYSRALAHAKDDDSAEPVSRGVWPPASADEPWLYPETQANPVVQETGKTTVRAGFWPVHGANICLAASAVFLAATLIWAVWPQPKKTIVSSNAPAVAAEPKLSAFEELLVSMGLAEAPPPAATYAGTPGTRVWVDVSSALYYCPGAEPYGKTPKGKFLSQRDAQDEQFQPARGQPCE